MHLFKFEGEEFCEIHIIWKNVQNIHSTVN